MVRLALEESSFSASHLKQSYGGLKDHPVHPCTHAGNLLLFVNSLFILSIFIPPNQTDSR